MVGKGEQGSQNAGTGDGACRGGHVEVGTTIRFRKCFESGTNMVLSQFGVGCDGKRGTGDDSKDFDPGEQKDRLLFTMMETATGEAFHSLPPTYPL